MHLRLGFEKNMWDFRKIWWHRPSPTNSTHEEGLYKRMQILKTQNTELCFSKPELPAAHLYHIHVLHLYLHIYKIYIICKHIGNIYVIKMGYNKPFLHM